MTLKAWVFTHRENVAQERRDDEFRRTDPVERAKTFIRSRGWCCYDANVRAGHRHSDLIFVGRMLMTRDELLDFARRKGWAG